MNIFFVKVIVILFFCKSNNCNIKYFVGKSNNIFFLVKVIVISIFMVNFN